MELKSQGLLVLYSLEMHAPSIQLKPAMDLARMFQDAWDQHRTDSEALAILAETEPSKANKENCSRATVAAWKHAFFRREGFLGDLCLAKMSDILKKWKERDG
jgi:hypothetical protein